MLKLAVNRAMAARASQDIELGDAVQPKPSPRLQATVPRRYSDESLPLDIDAYLQHIESIVKLQRFFRVLARDRSRVILQLNQRLQASLGLIGFLRFHVHLKVRKLFNCKPNFTLHWLVSFSPAMVASARYSVGLRFFPHAVP